MRFAPPTPADNPGGNTPVWQTAKSGEDLVHIADNHHQGKEQTDELSSTVRLNPPHQNRGVHEQSVNKFEYHMRNKMLNIRKDLH